ncbi:PAS domain-containing hybrid sensor histidine kinase/response regulator [Colwellia psychrerythraea]|uniref:Sensor protein FixL n=1 Tax=Colwellia psychrerythraea (strain 34H / ATCC BAA-681) TaxID=167879 RepID=Q485A7_COLP3|nr:PAS domain S-box protein [Colwellia psychrerythraea]AAZ25511.1 sensory box sensor histidine kinase/response regulator [Colwellia psychrerythraea 34H]
MFKSPENDSLVSAVFDSSPIGIQIIDLETGMREKINQTACVLLGDTKDNLMAKSVFEDCTWLGKDKFLFVIERLKENKTLKNHIVQFENHQGNELTISYDISEFKYRSKRLVTVSMNDVTEQHYLLKNISDTANLIFSDDDTSFFDNVTLKIAELFEAAHVFIGLNNFDDGLKMKTVSYCCYNQIIENFTYNLKHTPCANIVKDINGNACYVYQDVQTLFPKDSFFIEKKIKSYIGMPIFDINKKTIGGLILLFTKDINKNTYWEDLLKIFSGKISSELKHLTLHNTHYEAQQHLKLYSEQAPLALFKWDLGFNLLECNQSAISMLNYTEDELKQCDFISALVPINEQKRVNKTCSDLLVNEGGEHGFNSLIKQNGNIILTEWHNSLIKDDSGAAIGVISIVKDITQERQQLKRLAQKETEKREIINAIIDAVITINSKGIILSVNAATEKMFGYSVDELLGENIKLLMPKSTAVKHDTYLENYLQTKEAQIIGIGRKVIAIKKNGQEFPIYLGIAELSPDENNNIRYVGTCHDLSLFTEQQNKLQRIQKMDALGKLTGGIAHDFNNLLGIVSGFGELLELKLGQDPKLSKYCRQIITASERGSELTRKLLDFSKQESKKSTVCNINDLLTATQGMIAKTLTVLVTVNYTLADDLWCSTIDISAFDDVILNLCINAKHAMSNGGLLSISTQNVTLSAIEAERYNLTAGDFVSLTITDNGCGMNDKVKRQIFEPFYTTKGDEGTGLGLSQVYGFITSSQGSIYVYSETNMGTSINIYLPRSKPKESKNVLSKNVLSKSKYISLKGKENILVVDDEFSLGLLAKTILENEGYTVFQTSSGEDALFCLTAHNIDLIISDVIMPKTTGYQLIEKVRALDINIPIILATGFDGYINISKGNYSDIPIISKPYTSYELLTQTRMSLDSKKIEN